MPEHFPPVRPGLRRLKSRAQALHRSIRAAEPEALSTLRQYHPGPIDPRAAKLADAQLARAEFWYTPAIHFAVREGRSEAVRLLLGAGADPEWNGLHQGSLIEMAMERGYAEIARML